MRIASLLPALTELVAALGQVRDLVGVTHECEYPPGVELLPHLTQSRLAPAATADSIDAAVSEEGGGLYALDAELLARLQPDLILTQEQCDVCAVNEATVRRVAAGLPGRPRVESVNPTCLADVWAMFGRVGDLLGAREAAQALVDRFEAAAAEIARRRKGRATPRVLLLEWYEPPFSSGHWNPEIVALAGGAEVLGRAGERSRRLSWEEIAASDPEVILLSPCGFNLERSELDLAELEERPEWTSLSAVRRGGVTLVDGSAYFSPPGPRLDASLRLAAAAIDPAACADMAPAEGWRRLPPL